MKVFESGKKLWRALGFALVLCVGVQAGAAESQAISESAKVAMEKGLAATARGDWAGARDFFQTYLKEREKDPAGLANLGLAEFRLGNRVEAEKVLSEAVRIDSKASPAWLTLGMLYFEQQQLDAALAALSQAVWLEPGNAAAHHYLGATIGSKGWKDGAILEFQKAVELDPNYGEAHFNLAVIYLRQSPPLIELARRHYRKAVELGQKADPLVEKALNRGKE